jgi:hypothetical protein
VENLEASSADCNDEDIMRYLGEENISEVCNICETFRAGTGSTLDINEFTDYVDIDTHAMTFVLLTDEDSLEIVQQELTIQMKLKKARRTI